MKKGARVIIKSLKESKRYGINTRMKEMLESEKAYRVVEIDRHAALIEGYYFHTDDIELVVPKVDPVVFHFDERNL